MESGLHFCGGEYVDPTCEAEYRAEHLPEYAHQVRLCFWCAVVINLLFVFSDWRFYGHRHFYFAIAARAVLVIMSLACLAAMTKVDSFRHLQIICIVWACPVIAASAILVSPHTDIALLVTFILPALYYLAIPVSFRWALAFGLGSSVAALAAYMSPAPLSETSLGLMLGMLLCNVILVLVLSQSNRLRRLEWAATQTGRKANEELSEHRDMLQKILKAIPTPLVIADKESGRLIQVNDAARVYFGTDLLKGSLQAENYIGRRDLARLITRLRVDGQVAGFETQIRLPDGSARDVLLEATTVLVAGTEGILTIFVDITSRKELEGIMEKLANTDPLSGLANRARFFAVAVEEIRRAERYERPLAVFMVDIDLFKRINDTHGHETGDQVLKAFAKLCRGWVRSQDTVARLGGEEFGFLLPETDAPSALAMADRLRSAVEGLRTHRLQAPITISVGVSEVRPGESTVDAALSRADQALYAAKRAGRNRALLFDCAELDSKNAGNRN